MNNGDRARTEVHLEPPRCDSQSGGGDGAGQSGEGRAGLPGSLAGCAVAFSFQAAEVVETFQSECDQLCLLNMWQFIKMD